LLRSRTGSADAKQTVRRADKEDRREKGDRVRVLDAGRLMEGPDEEEKMNRKLPSLARAAVYLLAFVVPPVLVGVVGVKAALSYRYEGRPPRGPRPGSSRRPRGTTRTSRRPSCC
jgi:hypothetical protein